MPPNSSFLATTPARRSALQSRPTSRDSEASLEFTPSQLLECQGFCKNVCEDMTLPCGSDYLDLRRFRLSLDDALQATVAFDGDELLQQVRRAFRRGLCVSRGTEHLAAH